MTRLPMNMRGELENVVRRFGAASTALTAFGIVSIVCCLLVFLRVASVGTSAYLFLIWNLILAWAPFLFALAVRRLHGANAPTLRLLPFGFLWLLFFPNAPYILTDFIHLGSNSRIPILFDAVLIGSFAATGLMLGYASLYAMQKIVRDRWGYAAGWGFAAAALGLGSFGIYLGRVLRWNSWDVFVRPEALLNDMFHGLLDPFSRPLTVGFSIGLAALLTFTYFIVISFVELRVAQSRANNN